MARYLDNKLLVGWREWCSLPMLKIPAIKVKTDTGARTSALHASDIKLVQKRGKKYVSFSVLPIQNNAKLLLHCEAPLIDERLITSSNGHRERRYVILTPVRLGEAVWEIELTLSNRDPLKFRMLLGREAFKNRVIIDPSHSYHQGRIVKEKLNRIYGISR